MQAQNEQSPLASATLDALCSLNLLVHAATHLPALERVQYAVLRAANTTCMRLPWARWWAMVLMACTRLYDCDQCATDARVALDSTLCYRSHG